MKLLIFINIIFIANNIGYSQRIDWGFPPDRYVYGEECGIGSESPMLRIELKKILEDKNVQELEKWLSSDIAEKRVYAVDGFYSLLKKGFTPNYLQLRLINKIKKEEGKVRHCAG